MRYDEEMDLFQGRTLMRVSLGFYPRMRVVEEYRIFTRESIMGNIGGLAGFWVGLSVFGISEFVFAWMGGEDDQNPSQ